MEEADALPRGICKECVQDTLAALHFRRLCQQSRDHWANATNIIMQIQPLNLFSPYYILYNGGVPVQCLETSRDFEDSDEQLTLEDKSHPCKCPDCGKDFLKPKNLMKHLESTQRTVCLKCFKVIDANELVQHLDQEHNKTVLPCEICHQVFPNEKFLQKHTDKHRLKASETCKTCGIIFLNDRLLKYHMSSHSTFQCQSCSGNYQSRKCFKHHQKKCKSHAPQVSTVAVYSCAHCSQQYTKKHSLRTHITQKHLNVLPYKCNSCPKRFSTKGHLKSHEQTHQAVRDTFECHCGAKMQTEWGYLLHQRIHTGEKPYQCAQCGKRFLSSSRRSDHVKRIHISSKDMPHGCQFCHVRFIRPFQLKRHYLSVHKVDGQINEEPLCPLGVCVNCVSSAIAANVFRNLVKNSHSLWMRTIASFHISLPIPTRNTLALLYNADHPSLIPITDCDGKDPSTLASSLNKKTIKRKLTAERKPRQTKGQTCTCVDCGKTFLSPACLAQHLKSSGSKDACLICGVMLLRGAEMADHLRNIHQETILQCKDCTRIFRSATDLEVHCQEAHSPGSLVCVDCGRIFARSGTLEAHSQMHAIRTCRSCGKQFTNRGCYREHRSHCEPGAKPNTKGLPKSRRCNVRDPATFTCAYCNKTYNSRHQLKNHIVWIHMNIRPYSCQWCGKSFYTPGRLTEHSVVHTRERNFECDICGFKLVSKMAAVYHRRRHTGEKPYECPDCGDRFISASRRSEHAKRRHKKGTMIQCMQCSSSFVRGHELRKHMEKVHSRPLQTESKVDVPIV